MSKQFGIGISAALLLVAIGCSDPQAEKSASKSTGDTQAAGATVTDANSKVTLVTLDVPNMT